MNRGMITLSKAEITAIQSLLPTSQSIPPELPIRLTAALQESTDPVAILLSEDSVEAVLDILPPPSTKDAIMLSARTQFSHFLTSLRPAVQKILSALIIVGTLTFGLIAGSLLGWAPQAQAQGQATVTTQRSNQQATITSVASEEIITYPDGTQTKTQVFNLKLDSGEEVPVTVERLVEDNQFPYQVGDRVVVTREQTPNGDLFYIADFVRTPALGLVFGLFVLVVVAVSGWHGLRSLVGLASSFVVIFWFILPYIERGIDPIVVAIVGAGFIMLITFYLSHGFHRKTTLAVAGTFLALISTGLLSLLFIYFARLTGFATEEAVFLQVVKGSAFNAQGLMLAGIIIGTLGVLDDITLSQASVVQELVQANPKLTSRQLFLQAMNVGKDHIASLVNTLVLVYTGSSLPLLLLFQDSRITTLSLLNYEIIAEEIVRTLVGSMGLVLAVPITTFLAVWSRQSLLASTDTQNKKSAKAHHGHHHH